MLIAALLLQLCSASSVPPIVLHNQKIFLGSYDILGPFACGMDEVEGFAFDNATALAAAAPHLSHPLPSELANGGFVDEWQTVRKGTDGSARISFDAIDWNALYRAGGQEILEWQALVVARFETRAPGAIRCRCEGVAAYRVDGALAAGDVYGRYIPSLASTHELDAGVHEIRMRLRAKHVGSVRCSVWRSSKAYARSLAVPDWVVGDASPFGGLLSVEIWRPAWMRRVTLASEGTVAVNALGDDDSIPPATVTALRARLSQRSDRKCVAGEQISVPITVEADGERIATADVSIECRAPTSSALMAFLDGDGSVQTAAVVRPPASCGTGAPFRVLIALHGTGVSARSSADSYKFKPRGSSDDVDYTFGVPGACAFLLAPSRHGAHNWEGVGLRHALKALDALTAWRGAGLPQIVVAGHSMGGHGAGLLAAALGSRAKGVAINAGWPRKEVYGDSNTRYLHDQGAHLIEPALRGVLDATLAGSAVDAVASNLCCMRSLLRVGAVDEAVPPYHVRRIARLLEGCPASDYEEVPSKGHWWWDTAVANDGGTVNDERLRKFFAEAFSSQDDCPIGYEHVTTNVDAVLGSCGFRVEQQVVPFRTSRVALVAERSLRTQNVRRLALDAGQFDTVDGDAISDATRICRPGLAWVPCEATGRGPGTSGPMRQVVESAFRVVYEPGALGLATYLANQFHLTGHARAPISGEEFSWDAARDKGENIVFVGGGSEAAQRALNETAAPLGLRQDGVSVGECEFSGDLGVASLLPLQGDRLALLLAATSDEALDTTIELLATPTIPPMARQPFSNALPDVVVLDARQARRFGPGGFRLAGFWDHDWSFAHQASYAEECRRVVEECAAAA